MRIRIFNGAFHDDDHGLVLAMFVSVPLMFLTHPAFGCIGLIVGSIAGLVCAWCMAVWFYRECFTIRSEPRSRVEHERDLWRGWRRHRRMKPTKPQPDYFTEASMTAQDWSKRLGSREIDF